MYWTISEQENKASEGEDGEVKDKWEEKSDQDEEDKKSAVTN